MPSRLLTLMRKRGATFSPLSLNPTLLALPENSFSRTGGQFTAASSQYLSVASNASLLSGGSDIWYAGWVYFDTASGSLTILSNFSGGGAATGMMLQYGSATVGSASGNTSHAWTGATTGTWIFVMLWVSGGSVHTIVNGNSVQSTVLAGALADGSTALSLGSRGTSSYHNGRLDNVLFGKPPTSLGDGTSGSLAHTIATALFNSNNGLPFQSITAQQQTDWGIVSGWLDNSLTADAFGSNTLTNNNGVTQAPGKVNAIAVDNDPTYFVNDASTNDNDPTQVTLANRPLYKSAGYWTFDGTNDVLPVVSFAVPSYPFCMVAVIKADDTSGNRSVITIGESAEEFGLNITTDTLEAYARSSSSDSGASVAFTDTSNYNIAVAVFEDADTRKVYLNGSSTASVTATRNVNPSSPGLKIGDRFAASQPFDGNIVEVIVFSDYTASKLNSYGNYLVSKYPSLSLSWTDI